MGPHEWLAEFDRRAQAFRAERAALHARVGAASVVERASVVRPVVLQSGRDVDRGSEVVPRSAAGLLDLAHSLGWAARLAAALAADPAKGLISSVSLRFSRHDERGYAMWWNGAYQHGWYVGPDGLEALAGSRMRSRKAPKDGSPMIRGVHDVIEGLRLTRQ